MRRHYGLKAIVVNYQPTGLENYGFNTVPSTGSIDKVIITKALGVSQATQYDLIQSCKFWALDGIYTKYLSLEMCLEQLREQDQRGALYNIMETSTLMPIQVKIINWRKEIVAEISSTNDTYLNSVDHMMMLSAFRSNTASDWKAVIERCHCWITKKAKTISRKFDSCIQCAGWQSDDEIISDLLDFLNIDKNKED